jgi:gamma-tubulin complex component 5
MDAYVRHPRTQQTTALRRTIATILDMCVLFGEIFISFKGDTSTMARSTSSRHHHRSRRQRKIRKNVVGFSFSADEAPLEGSDSSEDEDDEDVDMTHEPNATSTFSFDDTADAYARIEKMDRELDSLVKFVRRGAESLASAGGPKGEAFGVLAFALEDWDL